MAINAEIHTLAAPYALHALHEDEVELFEEHLAECRACRTEVEEIRETAARLGASSAVIPPPRMKDEVLSRIREIRPLPPLDVPEHEPLESGARARARRRWWGPAVSGLIAAMAAGIVVLGVQLNSAQQELDQSQAIGEQMRELASAPDMEMVRAEADGSAGVVIMARSLDTAVLMVDGMEPPPDEHTYQLWFIDEAGARSAGVLGEPDDGRVGPFTASGLESADHLGITIEPEGGSDQPTTDPIMLIELPTA